MLVFSGRQGSCVRISQQNYQFAAGFEFGLPFWECWRSGMCLTEVFSSLTSSLLGSPKKCWVKNPFRWFWLLHLFDADRCCSYPHHRGASKTNAVALSVCIFLGSWRKSPIFHERHSLQSWSLSSWKRRSFTQNGQRITNISSEICEISMLAALARPSGQTLSRGDAPRAQAESSAVPPAAKNSATTAVADDTRQRASARIGGHNLNHTKNWRQLRFRTFIHIANRMI